MKMNVVVVGDTMSINYGDPILTGCTKYLVEKECLNMGIESSSSVFGILERGFQKSRGRIDSKLQLLWIPPIIRKRLQEFRNDIRFLWGWYRNGKKKYNERLKRDIKKETQLIVFAGGAMFSGSIQYALAIKEIVDYAKKNHIKVAFCSIGVERSINWKTKYYIRKALKNDNIVAFSTRDHVDELPKLMDNPSFYLQTPDSGLFASEAYGISGNSKGIIGVGVISYKAYLSIARDDKRVKALTEDGLFLFWAEIIKRLDYFGLKWKLFTNGGTADYNECLKFIDYLGLDRDKVMCPQPDSPRKLIEQISQFSVIIGHRLHSLIIGSSFCIPIVPVVWSDKIVSFAEMINVPYYWPSIESAQEIVDAIRLKNRMLYSTKNVDGLKEKSRNYISGIFKCICNG